MTVAKNYIRSQPLLIDVSNTAIHLSPEQFERLQSDNPDLSLELTVDGKLIVGDRPEKSVAEAEFSPDTSSISHLSSSKKYQFVELTPEETTRRVTAFNRFTEGQRQRWESLTPEEQAQSDRQFDELYKYLEESRR